MTHQKAAQVARLLLIPPLAALAGFLIITASVPAGDGLWGHICVALVLYVAFYGGWAAVLVGTAGVFFSLAALWLPPRTARHCLRYACLAVSHIALAGLARLLVHILMSV